jgi:NAD(P)-dependent dehydrogenase (short-subunit alcohol dehydrogenase family)
MSESVRTVSFRTLAWAQSGIDDGRVSTSERVLVYGAAGHTGRFVVDELLRRGLTPVVAGRSAERLAAVAAYTALDHRVADIDDPGLLRDALAGVGAVINCAGPFLDTAVPLARAAVDVGAHYLDVTAEQPAVAEVYRELDSPAREAGVAVVPAMAFYGGLADLLVTAALEGDSRADEVEVAIGLDRWWPTDGTRATGARNTAVRQVVRGGVLAPLADPAPTRTWPYPQPLGHQPAVQLPFSEVTTIHRHLDVGELTSYLNTAPLDDLHDTTTPPPVATDGSGRSAQQFVVDVVVRRGSDTRHVWCSGRDIYAVTAPIVVEGAARLLDGRHHGPGALAPGQAFDAADVLAALARDADELTLQWDRATPQRSAG